MADEKPAAWKSFLAGGAGGSCLVVVGHPLDTLKVRVQTGSYSSAWQCFTQTLKLEGPRGLYRGMVAPLIGVTPIFAISFWGFDVGQQLARKLSGLHEEAQLGIGGLAFAGAVSGVFTTAVMTPGERIKCILQIQGQQVDVKPKYNGPMDVVRGIMKEEGAVGLYRGAMATMLRDVPGSAAYFAGYEIVKRALTPDGADSSELSPSAVLFAGGMAGVFNWLVAIPPDTIKSRLQTSPEGTYKGIADCYKQLVAKEGHAALFRGVGPVMVRAFPANAACFFGYEMAMSLLNKWF